MDRIILATHGTYGDVHPFIGLALKLKRKGYLPVIASSERYRSKVTNEGIAFERVRPDEREAQHALGIDDAELTRRISAPGAGGIEFLLRSLVLPYLRQSYEDILRLTAQAQLIVTSSFAYGATLAAEKSGLPYVNVTLQPVMYASAYDPPRPLQMSWLRARHAPLAVGLSSLALRAFDGRIGRCAAPIHALRSEIGLPRASANPLLRGQFSPYANVGLYSRVLGDVQVDFPDHTTIAGFSLYDHECGQPQSLDEELERFLTSGPAPLVFALGSQAVHSPGDFFRLGANVARSLGMRAVLVVGRDTARPALSGPTAEVMVVPYAAYSQLFPRAAAVVHHGGIGTTGQALHSGRPQLIIPFWGDQHDNAHRVVRLGAGRTLRRSRVSFDRLSAELRLLLGSPAHAQSAAAVAASIREEDGADRAADIIADVLQTRASERPREVPAHLRSPDPGDRTSVQMA